MTSNDRDPQDVGRWPSLPVAEWEPTRDTLQLWTQIIGKVRLANSPLVNHWWNVPLYITARGMTTSLMAHPLGLNFEIELDLHDHRLELRIDDGRQRSFALGSLPVADFYGELMSLLDTCGVPTQIWPMPVEIPGAIPFDVDRSHATYDPDHAHRFWLLLVQASRVMYDLPQPVRRQVQSRPSVLGRTRPGRHPVLRTNGTPASRRSTQLRSARHDRGLFARGQ